MQRVQKSIQGGLLKAILPALLCGILASSCIPQSRLLYLQDKHDSGSLIPDDDKRYRVQAGDILYVRVMTTDPDVYDLFNIDERGTYRATTGDVGDPHMFLYGYSVNSQGNIELPVIGEVNVAGNTIEEIQKLIKESTREYLVDATVSVRLVNFKVTVLGEVNRPGTYNVYDEEFTVMDAIGVAGDMTDYGRREVHVVRKTDEGRIFEKLDLTDRESAMSELYYLKPNDMVYVEPMLAKRFALAEFPYSVLFSALSSLILLLNYIN